MISEKQIEAINLYVNGNTITDIVKLLGVSRQSIYNCLKEDEFQK
ncbi:Helix-turn-helix domain of resolvase [uncultured Clostridium sp.]|nr:Helix-turn-helix domain of resolvase [uncultured Clostridium sp.]